ncbi:hypothetical protein DYB26_003223 [Aphanomyces astaci]|uniref:Uncharacterized protein n=1 Tax=Aphanomyces astaci TaxID=112090 RepID=A0A418G2Z8_APHAT|nr:hypothetical protein DYB26_003223 [Aphanomyces astaci]
MEDPPIGNDRALNSSLAATTMKNANTDPVRIAPQVRRPDLYSMAVSKTAEGRGAKTRCGDCSDQPKDANSRWQWTSHERADGRPEKEDVDMGQTVVYLFNAPSLAKQPTFKGPRRTRKMLDGLAVAIRRDHQEWMIKEEGPAAIVKIITDAVKPVLLHRVVTERSR